MVAMASSSAINCSTVLKLARQIIDSSSRPQIRSLLVELTDKLTITSQAHYPSASSVSSCSTTTIPKTTKRYPWVSNTFKQLQSASEVTLPPSSTTRSSTNTNPPLSFANATYGETPPATISTILNILSEYNGAIPFEGHFVDAGSGKGGALVCAALEGMFHHCRGIEYNNDHSQAAISLQRQYDQKLNNPKLESSNYPPAADCCSIQFICGDLANERFHGASVVYSNAVLFDSHLCGILGHSLDRADLKPGAFVVTATRRFSLPSFDLVDVVRLPCNGGEDFTFYISQKRRGTSSATTSTSMMNNAIAPHPSSSTPAISDSTSMRYLREYEKGCLLEKLIMRSLQEGELEDLTFLTALGFSEPTVRLLSSHSNLMDSIGIWLSIEDNEDMKTRASTSMALRAIAAFPIGRRTIAEHGAVLRSIFASLDERGEEDCRANDHLVIRANLVDILGQVLHDHVGNEELNKLGIDDLIENVMKNIPETEGGFGMLRDACEEVKVMRRWRSDRHHNAK